MKGNCTICCNLWIVQEYRVDNLGQVQSHYPINSSISSWSTIFSRGFPASLPLVTSTASIFSQPEKETGWTPVNWQRKGKYRSKSKLTTHTQTSESLTYAEASSESNYELKTCSPHKGLGRLKSPSQIKLLCCFWEVSSNSITLSSGTNCLWFI